MFRLLAVCTSYLCLFYLIGSTCKAGDVTVEDQFKRLTQNYEMLERKLAFFERKILEHEVLIDSLQNKENSFSLEQSGLPNTVTTNSKLAKENKILRTCQEIYKSDASLSSGYYLIDPDGQGTGDPPIYVYCDLTSGSTSVLHDSESETDVNHCPDPGCYVRTVNYNATRRQISVLKELSSECHQSIQYECINSPLDFNGVHYSWWEDVNEISRYFWSGNDPNIHTCQCGIEQNCLDNQFRCNCDSNQQKTLIDNGTITEKSFLPVTKLKFGQAQRGAGLHTLGRLVCSGQQSNPNAMPVSCQDLWRIGHSLNGFYSVMGNDFMETVYCNFDKLFNENGFQTLIGYDDVQLFPTYFYVQKTQAVVTSENNPITFDLALTNVGNAMAISTGIFTARVNGLYFFTFSGLTRLKVNSSTDNFSSVVIGIKLNDQIIGQTQSQSEVRDYDYISMQSVISLQTGDRVWLEIVDLQNGQISENFHFSGWLLREEIF